jgi:hypothetical protein
MHSFLVLTSCHAISAYHLMVLQVKEGSINSLGGFKLSKWRIQQAGILQFFWVLGWRDEMNCKNYYAQVKGKPKLSQ